jgi:hypothetical protein
VHYLIPPRGLTASSLSHREPRDGRVPPTPAAKNIERIHVESGQVQRPPPAARRLLLAQNLSFPFLALAL